MEMSDDYYVALLKRANRILGCYSIPVEDRDQFLDCFDAGAEAAAIMANIIVLVEDIKAM